MDVSNWCDPALLDLPATWTAGPASNSCDGLPTTSTSPSYSSLYVGAAVIVEPRYAEKEKSKGHFYADI